MRSPDPTLSRLAAETIRFLAVDAVEKAKSGHPGMPMGAADVAFVLWSRFLRYDPLAPDWPDRDRFILSAGHGSMLLYALLHLAGYDLPIAEIETFRQWGSRTPGHPEFGHTPGVEATTGPLGQGVGNGVGAALSAKMLAARFGPDDTGFAPVGHRVFVLASDGDLMEGVSGEASSIAGHLRLGNLVVLWDDNRITIEGSTSLAFTEDVARRYQGYGWHVARCDGYDHEAIAGCLDAAITQGDRPSLIVCQTSIGKGAPHKQDSHEAHGAPLGPDEARGAKAAAHWPPEPPFHVPSEVRDFFRARAAEGTALRTGWETRFAAWRAADPVRAHAWDAVSGRSVPADVVERLAAAAPPGPAATREHGREVLQRAAAMVPALVGGSADLAPSTLTVIQGSAAVAAESFDGRNIHFGVREHAMGAILNGLAYAGPWRPFGSTFLVFADYMRPSIRIAALAKLPVVYVFTHDSIFVGEDGPTHQPIEHVESLRIIPGLRVLRPADGWETAIAWGLALERSDGPSAIVLTRQKVPPIARTGLPLADARRGAHVVAGDDAADAVVVATGSEVHLATAARSTLAAEGLRLRVVSMLCRELFEEQDPSWRDGILPPGLPVATVEAGRTTGWRGLAGPRGLTIGIDRFGASAPGPVVAEKLGLTAEGVVRRIREWMSS